MIILLAEDHVLSQALTVRLLQAEGHQVSVVGTGLQAIDSCRDQRFDVVLMDLQLPVLDGLTAIRAIREMQQEAGRSDHGRLWILALTADSGGDVLAACLEAGADGLLTKPIQPGQLVEHLRIAADADSDANDSDETNDHHRSDVSNQTSIACRDVLLDNVGQDKLLAQSLVDLFLRDYSPLIVRFTEAFHQHDFQVLMNEAHSLKSPARVFGANALHRLCDELEQVGKTHDAERVLTIQDEFLGELRMLNSGVSAFRFK
ncbi:MAG: response regulator [Fuerstiella sp.]